MSAEPSAPKSVAPSPSPARAVDAIDPPAQDTLEKTPDTDEKVAEDSDKEGPADDDAASTSATAPPPNAWQAIFSPQYNAYYFFNTETQETTWSNPLQPEASSSSAVPAPPTALEPGPSSPTADEPEPMPSTSTSTFTAPHLALQEAALAAGIDPSLAYLDPSLLGKGPSGAKSYTAKFNARTGAFTAVDARDPGHLSEFEVCHAHALP